jgi:hypothetical protein
MQVILLKGMLLLVPIDLNKFSCLRLLTSQLELRIMTLFQRTLLLGVIMIKPPPHMFLLHFLLSPDREAHL